MFHIQYPINALNNKFLNEKIEKNLLEEYFCNIVHQNVSCDYCGISGIKGIRVFCLDCVDYDLCFKCYKRFKFNKTHQGEHKVLLYITEQRITDIIPIFN
jgi:hypothetical protein